MPHLRPVQHEDREQLRRWRNLPEVARYMYSDHQISEQEHAAWFDKIMRDTSSRYWIICADGDDVGLANLYDINMAHRRAKWAFYIADDRTRGKGIGTFVEYQVLRYAFEDLGLHRLSCEVLAFNEAVINMHKRYGFQQDGVFRDHVLKNSVFVDAIFLTMLEDQWPASKQLLEKHLKAKGLLHENDAH
jgi:UDP-4-amino-4,6-dideoxy-N-acetyl-beta-L-altrosamine N-acetyltransferase